MTGLGLRNRPIPMSFVQRHREMHLHSLANPNLGCRYLKLPSAVTL